MLTELQQLYDAYLREAEEVRKNTPGMQGYMGMGNDPKQNPCHMAFYRKVEDWVCRFLQSAPDSRQVYEAVFYILQAADSHRGTDAYWYYFASQGLLKPLIPLLTTEDCRNLRDWYGEHYPKKERLPVHTQLFKILTKCAK